MVTLSLLLGEKGTKRFSWRWIWSSHCVPLIRFFFPHFGLASVNNYCQPLKHNVTQRSSMGLYHINHCFVHEHVASLKKDHLPGVLQCNEQTAQAIMMSNAWSRHEKSLYSWEPMVLGRVLILVVPASRLMWKSRLSDVSIIRPTQLTCTCLKIETRFKQLN